MKKLITIILTLFFGIQFVIGQTNSKQTKNWDKIIIEDYYRGWYHFSNRFQIKRENFKLTILNKPDSIIKIIKPKLIDDLFNSLITSKLTKEDPLLMFGKDSTWLITNAEKLWTEYKKNQKESEEINSIAINTIKDYQKVKNVIWSLQGSHWTDDYPSIRILIITGQDTLFINSYGQYPFMMPWTLNGKRIYNYKIPTIIGKILPVSMKTNKSRLSGKNFNYHLIDNIYRRYIENEVEFVRARNKFPHRFKTLSKYFEIIDAEMSMMGSIEWGGLIASNCLEIILKDSTISKNIQFSTVFGRKLFLHPTRPLIRKKDNILNQLNGNPVFEYCLKNKNCLGKIHFVNHKSLSNQTKREFLRDVKSNGQNKSKYKRKFKNAIFFELTEYRDNKRSFSSWIFLQDGTLLLWQLRGNFLMGLSYKYSKENGYICKKINRNEI